MKRGEPTSVHSELKNEITYLVVAKFGERWTPESTTFDHNCIHILVFVFQRHVVLGTSELAELHSLVTIWFFVVKKAYYSAEPILHSHDIFCYTVSQVERYLCSVPVYK